MYLNNVKIREAIETDYEAVNGLYCQLFNSYHDNMPLYYKKPPENALSKGTYLNILEDKEYLFFVAEMNDKVIGSICGGAEECEEDEWTYSDRRLHIEELIVDSAFENNNIFALLIDKVENWTIENGMTGIATAIYNFDNQSMSLYKKHGYAPYSVRVEREMLNDSEYYFPDWVNIRKATELDYEIINNLYHQSYCIDQENIPDHYKKMPETVLPNGTYLNMIDARDALVYVAELDNKVVGVVYGEIEENKSDKLSFCYKKIYIQELIIDSEFRGKGIGTLLIKKAEDHARKNKISNISILVYAFNNRAINFYEKNGYQIYYTELSKKLI